MTIMEFRKGVIYLKLAEIYAQRIDWLVSGDDGEEAFHKRLKEELSETQVLTEWPPLDDEGKKDGFDRGASTMKEMPNLTKYKVDK